MTANITHQFIPIPGLSAPARITTALLTSAPAAHLHDERWVIYANGCRMSQILTDAEFTALTSEETLGRVWNAADEEMAWKHL